MKASYRDTLLKHLFKLSLFTFMALSCGIASAQDKSGDDEYTLDEVIVTAEFREKELQETPLSITAVNAETLEMRNQTSLADISQQAPNVSLRPNNSSFGSSLVAYIRGVGQTDFNPSVEAGVGIYVDDVYYSTITGNILDLLDLERVEILRGPQGTLAGRNAIGGAIKLFTSKPDGKNEGYISLTYGDYNRMDLRGAGGFSITDKIFARISGTSRSRDGYVTTYDYACMRDLPEPGTAGGLPRYTSLSSSCKTGTEGGQRYSAGRLALRWVPSDKFEVNFSTNIVRDKSESQPSVLIAAKNSYASSTLWYSPNGPVTPPFADPTPNNPLYDSTAGGAVPIFYDNNGNGTYEPDIDVGYDSRFVTAGTYYNYSNYIDDGTSTPSTLFVGSTEGADINAYKPFIMPRINHLETEDYTLTFDWELSDNTKLRSITSYREYMNIFASDGDLSPLALNHLLQRMIHEQWTQEIRLNTVLFNGFTDLTFGVFYLDQETNEDARADLNFTGLDFAHGPDIVPATSKALYSQASLHLNKKTDLTLGLRYTRDEKSYTFARHNPDGSAIEAPATLWFWESGNPANAGVFGLDGTSVSYSSDRLDWRTVIDYDITDRIMVYGQIATGYKAGGNNARPFFASQVNSFDPEVLTNYEVGVKSNLFNQLRLNASVFYNDYKDIQLPVNSCVWADLGQSTPCNSQASVGDAEVKGLEIEGMWRPTRAFSIDFSYAYLDFQYKRINDSLANPALGAVVTIDMTTPYTPENKWSIGAQYRFELGKMGDLTPRLDVSYQDDCYATAVNSPLNKIEGYTLANARVTWRSEDLKWQVGLEVTNLTDKYYYLTIHDQYDSEGYINGQPGRPREMALTVKRIWYFD